MIFGSIFLIESCHCIQEPGKAADVIGVAHFALIYLIQDGSENKPLFQD